MSDHAGKVANARKKLKEFQAKRGTDQFPVRPAPSPSLSVSSTSEVINGRVSVNSISHEDTPHSYSQRQTPELRHEGHESSSDCSEAHQTVEKLRVHLSRAQRDYNALHEKHQELVSHYSNLHSTYEQLLNNPPVSKSTEAQITKLQAALTAAVEEKTTLQGTLRSNDQRISDLMDQVKQLEHIVEEAKSHQASTDAAPEPISIVQESQIRKMESEIQTLHGTISRQQEELIRMHKDGANMEVRIQRMQQDQNDAQARLRMAYRDNEQKAELVSGLQKKCELLEIHVGQMREHGIGPDGSMGLIDENSQLKEKLSDLITENDDLKKQVDAARVYYDSYKMDLDERMTELTKQFNDQHELLQQRTDELNMATDQICDMKLELQTMQDKQNSSRDGSPESDTLQNEFEALQEYAKDLHNKYTVACDKQQESISEYLRVKNAYEALKTSYETCEVQLDEERRSLRRLKEATENTQLINTDIRSLTEQLANEKATVSRAVSQNSELKEQLIEMEDKLIKIMNESAEREQQLQSARFTIEQLNGLQPQTVEYAENGHVPQPNGHHVAENDLSQNPQNDIEENSESNSTSVEDETETVHDDHDHCEHGHVYEQSTKKIPVAVIPEPEVIALREKLQDVTDQLETLRSENRRIVAENSEFHRIMEQNAEDENQNNIHVELGDAINRINDLNAENEQLRLELSNTTVAAQPAQADAQHQTHEVIPVQDEPAAKVTEEPQQPVASQSPVPNPQKAHEPVASVTEEKQSVGSPQWTLKELEGRLVRALEQNAEYSDKNERLEHMLIALESENDTIGEYVTLYQHQRSKIRTKLAERDEQIAHLTLEKMRVQKKLNELQSAVFSLLTKRGLLQSYQTGEVVRGAKHAHDGQGHRKVSKRAGKTRTFSQSISDELSGEEEVVVDSEELYLPPLPDKDDKNLGPNIDALENQLTEVVPSNGDKVVNGNVETASCERKPQDDGDIRVTKILQLLSDLQDPDAPSQPFDLNLHCKDCRGNLMTV